MAFKGPMTPDQVADEARQQLRDWDREHDFAVCIDTDGAVVDNMWAKQLIVFHPHFMDMNGLREIELFFRIHAEHHNLWGKTRGCDRYLAVKYVLESLQEDPDAQDVLPADHVRDLLASLNGYVDYVQSDDELGFGVPTLTDYHREHGLDFNVTRLLGWSEAVNRTFEFVTLGMPPFDGVEETLQWLSERADLLVVSSTPYSDLVAWWGNTGLDRYVQSVAGKEMGKKSEHIRVMMESGGYQPDEVMMIGDGGGDLEAARANDALFYPICAGREPEAWDNMRGAFEEFFAGDYRGEMEDELIQEFHDALKAEGPWEKPGYDAREEYLKLQQKRIDTYELLHPNGKLFVLDD